MWIGTSDMFSVLPRVIQETGRGRGRERERERKVSAETQMRKRGISEARCENTQARMTLWLLHPLPVSTVCLLESGCSLEETGFVCVLSFS